jgi:Flp pilus assembly protein CpaB
MTARRSRPEPHAYVRRSLTTRRGRGTGWLRDLRRAATWHRRLLVAGLLAASVAFAIEAVSPPPPRTESVLVAAKDLAGGTRLRPDDVRLKDVAPASLPDGAVRTRTFAAGRTLDAPVRKGEVLTDVRLVGQSFLDSYGDGLVAAPVRIADAASVQLVRAGDIVDVLAAGLNANGSANGSATGAARLVAAATPVLTIPPVSEGPLGSTDIGSGALVVVVTSSETAARLAAAAVTDRLSLVIHGS